MLQCNDWVKIDTEKYLPNLNDRDRQAMRYIKQMYGDKTSDELIRITYIKYPQLAVNSVIAKDKLSAAEYRKVIDTKPISNKTILFTIGYEGISLEEYINKLIVHDIKVLCDVRKNSLNHDVWNAIFSGNVSEVPTTSINKLRLTHQFFDFGLFFTGQVVKIDCRDIEIQFAAWNLDQVHDIFIR